MTTRFGTGENAAQNAVEIVQHQSSFGSTEGIPISTDGPLVDNNIDNRLGDANIKYVTNPNPHSIELQVQESPIANSNLNGNTNGNTIDRVASVSANVAGDSGGTGGVSENQVYHHPSEECCRCECNGCECCGCPCVCCIKGRYQWSGAKAMFIVTAWFAVIGTAKYIPFFYWHEDLHIAIVSTFAFLG